MKSTFNNMLGTAHYSFMVVVSLGLELCQKAVGSNRGKASLAILVTALLFGGSKLLAQSMPPQYIETITISNLVDRYPTRLGLSNNLEIIKKYLSAESRHSIRLSTSTETAHSKANIAKETKQYGQPIFANLHSHINFGSNQFLVELLNCSPESYSLSSWQPVTNSAKIRSDELINGTFYVMKPKGKLSSMEFGDFNKFKEACIAAQKPLEITSSHNVVLERASIDFRQYARFQNLGHEGVIPNSYVFDGNSFTCFGMRGGNMNGKIHTNLSGLVDKITYESSQNYGLRVFLLFYEKTFTNCSWFPSRILDISPVDKNGKCSIRSVHTIYNVFCKNSDEPLPLPMTVSEFYGTNVSRVFFWSNGLNYEIQGSNVFAQSNLSQTFLTQRPRGGKSIFGLIFLSTSVVCLIAIIFFTQKNHPPKK